MPITSADIKILASARMVDDDDGGGPMTGSALQDGAENNVFLDVSSTDRAFGDLALRKVFAAVLPPTGTDTLLGANVIIQDMPDDANVTGFAFLSVSATEERDDAVGRLQVSHWVPLGPGGDATLAWVDAATLTSADFVPQVGMVIYGHQGSGSYAFPVLLTSVTPLSGDDYTVTYAGTRTVAGSPTYAKLGVPSTTSPRLASTKPITGTLSIGATYCDVDNLLVAVVPKAIGLAAGTAAQIGIDAVPVVPEGRALGIRTGDGLVVHHTATVAAATYANADTVNFGRTDLAAVRLVDVDGLGITAGWTVNLATGIATVNDISTWAQPMTWHHTIEEVLACSRTGYSEVTGGSSGGTSTSVAGPFTIAVGAEMYAGRSNVGRMRVISRSGLDITDRLDSSFGRRYFVQDLSAGTTTFVPAGDSAAYNSAEVASMVASHSPVTLVSSGVYYAPSTPTAPQATPNRVTFNRALTRGFPSGSKVSSMLLLGDLQARAGAVFSQQTWTTVWADGRIGDAILPQYQQSTHPIVVTDLGAINERWAVIFNTSTGYRLVGESVGQILASGDTSSLLAPVNPATGVPYFSLAAAGWGSGWSAGNVLRFNTRGSNAALWSARAVLPSAPSPTPDSLTLAVRGDIDA